MEHGRFSLRALRDTAARRDSALLLSRVAGGKEELSALAGCMRVRFSDSLFYAAFAIIVVSFVRVAGLLLTFAYLIVPAVCAVMLAELWKSRLLVGWGIAVAMSTAVLPCCRGSGGDRGGLTSG